MSFFSSGKKTKQQQSEIETLTQERDNLKQSYSESTQKIRDEENRSAELLQDVERLKIENTELKNKLHTEEPYEKIYNERQDLKEENSKMASQIKEFEKELKNKEETMAETMKTYKEDQDRAQKETDELVKDVEKYKERLKELETEREEQENKIDDLEKKNNEFEDEMVKLKEDFVKIKNEKEDMSKLLEEEKENEVKRNRQYIEDLRRELAENRNKIEGMLLESEALKSENESLFRANESKKDEINEIQKEVGSIKNELQLEKLRYKKIKEEWDEEKRKTEFVLVSKSAKERQRKGKEASIKEENDSEDEHVVGVIEAAKVEKETMIAHERELRKRVNQLQIDKEELFRSGTNLFTENKSLKAKYDQILGERTMLLQVEAALKRKVREQEREIKDMKKTIDDLYYQNMAIRTNEENENKKSSYVVVMGNEMIKQLEREKSALHRRVKFLEKENNEIETRVIELERQSADLVNYSKKYDKHSNFPEVRRSRDRDYRDAPRSRDRNREHSIDRDSHRIERDLHRIDRDPHRIDRDPHRVDRDSHRMSGRDNNNRRNLDYRPPSGKTTSYHEYREKPRHDTTIATRSPDYYKSNAPPFTNSPSRQPSIGPASIRSMQSQDSRFSLPFIGSRATQSPRPCILSELTHISMSSAGTTLPGRAWVSSKPPNYVTQPGFKNEDGNLRERSPDLFQASPVKYDPQRPGGTIFTGRTLNTFKKKGEKPGILKKPEGNDQKKPNVRFSETDQDENDGREVVTTNLGGGVVIKTTKSYESVIAERDALLESDKVYRRRIKQLEEENTQILLDYEGIYKENNTLRDKLDKGDDNHIESYQRVYADRQILREAETAYKRRITQLEQDAKEMLTNFETLYGENKVLRDKAKKLEERLNSIDRLDDVKKINELEKKCKMLEKTVRTMGYEREDLVRMNHELDNGKYRLKEDLAEMNKRNNLLEKENEGLKRGFMALGKNTDESWKDELKQKTRRQEEEERLMREEHAKFKKEIDILNKEMHKLEKVNVEMQTRNNMLENDKADFEKRMFELAKETGRRTPSGVKRRNEEMSNIKDQKIEEMTQKIEELKNENIELKAKTQILEKEKETFEQRLEEASTKKRETASSIRRKMETEREIRDLNMHIENFKEKVKRLEVENSDLKEESKRMEIEAKAQKQASKALASGQASQLDVQIKDLNEKLIAQNNELKLLTEENLKLKTEYNNVEEKLQDQLDLIKKEKESLLQEKESLQNNIDQSTSTASGKIQELQDELNALQVELQLLKPKHEDLQNLHEELKADNKSLNTKYEENRDELEKLKESLRSSKDVYNELSKCKRENVSLQREIDGMEDKFKTERLKLESDLEELLKNQEFMNTALSEHKVRLDMLQQEKNDFKTENIKLVKANERQSKMISDLQKDVDKVSGESSSRTASLKDELEKTQKELKKTETELIQAKQEIEIAKNERENQVNKLLKQMDKLKAEREIETQQLKDQSESLRSEVARLKVFEDRIQNMETNLKELVQKLRETEERNKDVTNEKLLSLQQVVKEMKSENLANRIRAAEREQNELEKHKMELEIKQDAINEIRKLKDENGRLLGLLEDKRAAEEAQDEWTKKKHKLNEILAQNKRLQEENTRLLALVEGSHSEHLRKDLQAKTEKLKLIESKYQEFTVENANLRQAMEEKENEIKKIGLKADRITRIQHENRRLMTESQRLRDEMIKKDNLISSLKELESTKAKYMDAAANNQRLYEENMRLRETIEKSKDYKSEFNKVRDQEKATAASSVKYQEETALLKNTLQVKDSEFRRELELHKERANNIKARNKRLIDEMAKLKDDINRKDDLIIKLRGLESAEGKLKDASTNASRLYEENQRLRNLLENNGGGWKGNFQNAKSLSANRLRDSVESTAAVYVEPSKTKVSADRKNKLLKERIEEGEDRALGSAASDEDGRIGTNMKIKRLTKLPDIPKKEGSGLLTGLSYSEIHQKAKGLKGEKLVQALTKELEAQQAKLQKQEKEIKTAKEELNATKPDFKRVIDERDTLKSEVARLKKELDVKTIGESMNRTSQLQEQNKRLVQENHRLREEISARDLQLANHGAPGYSVAHYVDNGDKTTEEKLKLSMAENRRLQEENNRLRAALDETHVNDTGSRFKDPQVTGSMIEGFKDAKSKKWATFRGGDKIKKKEAIKKKANETDDNKLMKLEEMVDT
ncbi:trichohyalin-like [Mercenaria mercenaria]|uniref:trichohyalin-like n=1 Tax=Mercenaria mercenaria TaxID=6596 RepID=UPI00234EB44E|nr:trichohyalin-like [Mercenaria mercenaria]